MKFKISAAIIIALTVSVIGIMTFLVNKTPAIDNEEVVNSKEEVIDKALEKPARHENNQAFLKNKNSKEYKQDLNHNREDNDDSDDDEEEREEVVLSEEDKAIITEVANLSEAALASEIESLKKRIEKEDLFELLENDELTGSKKEEAKAVLERFALLGLETTRRQYMDSEPELKDPLNAHSESLKEIRELLSDD